MSDLRTLNEILSSEEKWSVFSRLLETTGASEWLTLDEQFTVFAPTNEAFENFPGGKLDELINEPNQPKLKYLLSYHFMPGKVHSEDLTANQRKSITGDELAFEDSEGLKVNGARIQTCNIRARNGAIHQIDAVMAPPMKTAVKHVGVLEAAKTRSAAPIRPETPPAIGSALRKTSTIF